MVKPQRSKLESKFSVKKVCYGVIFFFCPLALFMFYQISQTYDLKFTDRFKYPKIIQEAFTQQPQNSDEATYIIEPETKYPSSKQLTEPASTTSESTSNLDDQKTILMWYLPFGKPIMALHYTGMARDTIDLREDWETTGFEFNTSLCGSCRVTFDRSELGISSAVLFHARDIRESNLPSPSLRKENQLYVWWSQESSLNSGTGGNTLRDYFNASMFLRRSSSIYSPYLSFRVLLHRIWKKQNGVDLLRIYNKQMKISPLSEKKLQSALAMLPHHSMAKTFTEIPSHISKENAELIKKKDRKTAWIVSNCRSTAGAVLRHDYYEKLLSAGLVIDMYGRCGTWQYPVKSRLDPAFYEILSKYKFYLSMENSFHCQDYITEKLWSNALYSGAIPVVLGPHKDDVTAILPPKSYIHIEDFASPQELVNYLQYLDQNVTAYAEYLEWRDLAKFFGKNPVLDFEEASDQIMNKKLYLWNKYAKPAAYGLCGLCKRLHDANQTNQVIHSIGDMLNNDRRACLNSDLARNIVEHNSL